MKKHLKNSISLLYGPYYNNLKTSYIIKNTKHRYFYFSKFYHSYSLQSFHFVFCVSQMGPFLSLFITGNWNGRNFWSHSTTFVEWLPVKYALKNKTKSSGQSLNMFPPDSPHKPLHMKLKQLHWQYSGLRQLRSAQTNFFLPWTSSHYSTHGPVQIQFHLLDLCCHFRQTNVRKKRKKGWSWWSWHMREQRTPQSCTVVARGTKTYMSPSPKEGLSWSVRQWRVVPG